MGFKENLKDELTYQGMLVKELAEKSGVPKGTIDHYLAEKCTAPIAENAVKIAQVLGVSVEYLVTGKDFTSQAQNTDKMSLDAHLCRKYYALMQKIDSLPENLKNPLCRMIENL